MFVIISQLTIKDIPCSPWSSDNKLQYKQTKPSDFVFWIRTVARI